MERAEPADPTEPSPAGFPIRSFCLFALVVLAQLVTYVLPAGEFERDGRRVISGTYHLVEADPLPVYAFLTSIPAGLAAAQDIIFFVFVHRRCHRGDPGNRCGRCVDRWGHPSPRFPPDHAHRRHGAPLRAWVVHDRHG